VNQWSTLRKHSTGSNLVDLGRGAARDSPTDRWAAPTPKPALGTGGEATLKVCGIGVAMLPE